jgi:hypothetical protein
MKDLNQFIIIYYNKIRVIINLMKSMKLNNDKLENEYKYKNVIILILVV